MDTINNKGIIQYIPLVYNSNSLTKYKFLAAEVFV